MSKQSLNNLDPYAEIKRLKRKNKILLVQIEEISLEYESKISFIKTENFYLIQKLKHSNYRKIRKMEIQQERELVAEFNEHSSETNEKSKPL